MKRMELVGIEMGMTLVTAQTDSNLTLKTLFTTHFDLHTTSGFQKIRSHLLTLFLMIIPDLKSQSLKCLTMEL